MSSLLIAALAVFASPTMTMASTQAAPAQVEAPAPALPSGVAPTGIPVLPPATESADCGGLLNSAAYCVTAQLDQVGSLADAYLERLATEGWLAADGDENRVILVRRREGGGCDGMQMIAFYDQSRPAAPALPAYLGFATIPGDVCTAVPAAGATPQ